MVNNFYSQIIVGKHSTGLITEITNQDNNFCLNVFSACKFPHNLKYDMCNKCHYFNDNKANFDC